MRFGNIKTKNAFWFCIALNFHYLCFHYGKAALGNNKRKKGFSFLLFRSFALPLHIYKEDVWAY